MSAARMGGPGGDPIDWSGPNDWDAEPTPTDVERVERPLKRWRPRG